MKELIKSKIENFVLAEMDKIQSNDESENVGNRNYAIENVKEFIKILQEDDKIEYNYKLESLKIENDKNDKNDKNDIERSKISKDESFNNRKLDIEDKRIEIENKTNVKKIDNDFMINNRKLDIEEISGNESLKLKTKELAQEIVRDTMNDKVKLIDLGVQAAGIILPIIFYMPWPLWSIEYSRLFQCRRCLFMPMVISKSVLGRALPSAF